MSVLKTVRFRMRTKSVKALDALVGKMGRNRTYVLNEAVARYLKLNSYKIKSSEKGLSASDRENSAADTSKWFAAMDRSGGDGLLKKGRKQPLPPSRKIFD